MKVHLVDPPAYTPPYDHALASALAATGLEVDLFTGKFGYAELPPPAGYKRTEFFYRHARGSAGSRARRVTRAVEHVPDMLRYRAAARAADVVHFQWLTLPQLDRHLLPQRRPLVLTAHDIPARALGTARSQLLEAFDAVIVHSAAGRERLVSEIGLRPDLVHVIPHGAFAHLAALPDAPLPVELERTTTDSLVVLSFGLIRPYKGLDVLLDAWRGIEGAELWIVGRPRFEISELRAAAPPRVRWVPRFVSDSELAACFRRADLVVLPYRDTEQSGVLATALAFGSPLLASDVGGFKDLAEHAAAHLVPPGSATALHDALAELIGDPGTRAQLASAATNLATQEWSWPAVADQTSALYRSLLS